MRMSGRRSASQNAGPRRAQLASWSAHALSPAALLATGGSDVGGATVAAAVAAVAAAVGVVVVVAMVSVVASVLGVPGVLGVLGVLGVVLADVGAGCNVPAEGPGRAPASAAVQLPQVAGQSDRISGSSALPQNAAPSWWHMSCVSLQSRSVPLLPVLLAPASKAVARVSRWPTPAAMASRHMMRAARGEPRLVVGMAGGMPNGRFGDQKERSRESRAGRVMCAVTMMPWQPDRRLRPLSSAAMRAAKRRGHTHAYAEGLLLAYDRSCRVSRAYLFLWRFILPFLAKESCPKLCFSDAFWRFNSGIQCPKFNIRRFCCHYQFYFGAILREASDKNSWN